MVPSVITPVITAIVSSVVASVVSPIISTVVLPVIVPVAIIMAPVVMPRPVIEVARYTSVVLIASTIALVAIVSPVGDNPPGVLMVAEVFSQILMWSLGVSRRNWPCLGIVGRPLVAIFRRRDL